MPWREQQHQRRDFPLQPLVAIEQLFLLARMCAARHDQFFLLTHRDRMPRQTSARLVGEGLVELDVPGPEHAS